MKLTKLARVALLGVMLLTGTACNDGMGSTPSPETTPTLVSKPTATCINGNTNELSGTYSTGSSGTGFIESYIFKYTFKGDTVTVENDFRKIMYQYNIPGGLESGLTIHLINPATGEEVGTKSFEYLKERDVVVIDNTEYLKQVD